MNRKVFISAVIISIFFCISVSASEIMLEATPEYKPNKNIIVFGNKSEEFSEYGILVSRDESLPEISPDNAMRLPAAEADASGRFGIELSDHFTSSDEIFKVRAYGIRGEETVLSDNTITVNKKEYYGRIPSLKSVSASSGIIYPSLQDDTNRYFILVDEDISEVPSLEFEGTFSNDKITYSKAENIDGVSEIYLETGFSSRKYTFEVRRLKKLIIPADKYRIKRSGYASEPCEVSAPGKNVNVSDDSICYVSFNTDYLPEKFITAGASLSYNDSSVKWYKATEPDVMTREFNENYFPQYEDITKDGSIDLNKLTVKSDFSLAFVGEDGFSFPTDMFIELNYFEDIPLPVFTDDPSTAELASVNASSGGEIYPEISKDVNEYYAVYEALDGELPEIEIQTKNPKATYSAVYGEDSCTITVTSEDGKASAIYKVNYREYKNAVMKLAALGGKRSPYELFNMKFPMSGATPYYSYPGVVSNFAGTGYSHFTAMTFDTSDVTEENIKIASAELQFYMATNCTAGAELEFYRLQKTDWQESDAKKMYFAVANRHINKGAEGVLNKNTVIRYTGGGSSGNVKYYRYYTVPLNTVGFTDANSINLGYVAKYQTVNPPSGNQYNYLWLGKNGAETENGLGMYPSVTIKYFEM